MLLHKTTLTLKPILELAKQEVGKGYIFADKERVLATDGNCLVLIKNPDQKKEEDLSSYFKEEYKNCETAVISETTLNKIERNLPKKPSVPVWNNFIAGKQDDKLIFMLSDGENDIKIKQFSESKGAPPNVDFLFERIKEIKYVSLKLQLRLLEKVIAVLKKIQTMVKLPKEISVEVKLPADDKNKPAILELKWDYVDREQGIDKIEAIALIMPMSI